MSYKVVIPTAGVGSRLKHLTRNLNKSLVSVVNKPVISYIIDQFPTTCEFVIALGYKGDLVKEFIDLAYPNRKFYFVNIKNYKGKGSGLGHTLLKCSKYLQEPFVFTSCDTIIKGKCSAPKNNWMGFAKKNDLNLYRTLEINKHYITNIFEKKKKIKRNEKAYIGLAGIYDYQDFWKAIKRGQEQAINQGEVYALREILKKKNIRPKKFEWFDSGNLQSLAKLRKEYRKKNEPNILEKENEAIWFVDKKVIKFSSSSNFIKNRVERANNLKGFVPKILDYRKNMYSYSKIRGDIISRIITIPLFDKLLDFLRIFWKKSLLKNYDNKIFRENCYKFYFDKTKTRIDLFYKNSNKKDGIENINGDQMPTLKSLLNRIDWNDLSNGLPGRFHGDLHFENILWEPQKKNFKLLDWRQDFAQDLIVGDIYYDLAKILHGLIISHELIVKNIFSIKWTKKKIQYHLHRKKVLKECEKKFEIWCKKNNFSYKKIRILTALIYLNISSLHHYPYSLFLYAIGKHMLSKELR